MKKVPLKNFAIGPGEKLAVMCGPCVIESESHTLECAKRLVSIFKGRNLNLIFKASYDKANRSSYHSFRGPGLQEGLKILKKVEMEFGIPVITDVHTVEEAQAVCATLECVQIPAFLCRQTDLVYAAAQTKAVVSVKKGQFMSPYEMKNVVEKIRAADNERVILVERGTTFGYNNLVCDMRSIPIMQGFAPVCFDATHSVALPGGQGTRSGGERQYIPTLAKAAIAAGANCLFMETHPNPAEAMSDKDSVLPMDQMPQLLDMLEKLYEVVNAF